eukprot:SAG31_NODE_21_length_34109_cov_60.598824_29_plen_149_part_00
MYVNTTHSQPQTTRDTHKHTPTHSARHETDTHKQSLGTRDLLCTHPETSSDPNFFGAGRGAARARARAFARANMSKLQPSPEPAGEPQVLVRPARERGRERKRELAWKQPQNKAERSLVGFCFSTLPPITSRMIGGAESSQSETRSST